MIETARMLCPESSTIAGSGLAAGLLEEFAYRYGRSYDSYLVNEPDRESFLSRSGDGAVGFVRVGKYLKVGGGLLAPDESKPGLLGELVEYAARGRHCLSFYNVTDDDVSLFRDYGFQVTKWGEEAIVDLPGRTWEGRAFEWVRRQTNYCLRSGLVFSECRRDELSADEWETMLSQFSAMSAALLAAKPQSRELQFLDGSFDANRLGRKRIFIARGEKGRGRVEGFLVANPGDNGRLWSFELYRHRPDAVRGTVTFLMHQAMRLLQHEGAERVSLCLLPGLRSRQPRPGDSVLARRGIACGSRYFNFLFDTAGLYHFKSRFRPRYENRYICALPKITFGSAWALIRLLGVLDVEPRKLARIMGQRCRKWLPRATLAVPE
jgi:phosphatidylglycerol lysyltransferase